MISNIESVPHIRYAGHLHRNDYLLQARKYIRIVQSCDGLVLLVVHDLGQRLRLQELFCFFHSLGLQIAVVSHLEVFIDHLFDDCLRVFDLVIALS